jgi:hypothetical protein
MASNASESCDVVRLKSNDQMLYTQAITNASDGAGRWQSEQFGGYQVCCDLLCRRR